MKVFLRSAATQLTVQDLWDDPAAVADFLNLENWRKETSRRAITTTTTTWRVYDTAKAGEV